jgi:hypothetical protein
MSCSKVVRTSLMALALSPSLTARIGAPSSLRTGHLGHDEHAGKDDYQGSHAGKGPPEARQPLSDEVS